MASSMPETARKIFTAETLRSAAKQSSRLQVVPLGLRRAIKKYLREQENSNMKRKVLSLSESFNNIKDANAILSTSSSKEFVEDPLKSMEQTKRWKIETSYGDAGLKYRDDETIAYVASRMPAVYSACQRILREVRRRLPGFTPTRVLDFGSGTGSVMWAMREVWPRSLERINLVEPSKSMQRAGQSLLLGLKDLPLIKSYDNIQALTQNLDKSEREHDLVMASYVLGEVPSVKDRITIVRQLWDLTGDVLVLVEPGTPQGFKIISQMRSHILWMEKRKFRKFHESAGGASKSLQTLKTGAFVVAPCAHDGACPLANTGTYCHFVQRLERTTSQRAYKRSKGEPLRGFEDEKFCYVVLKRGQRPRDQWPLDGMKFETLKEQHARRKPEDLEIDYDDQFGSEDEEEMLNLEDRVSYNSDVPETVAANNDEELEEEEVEESPADLGTGWGRILFSPMRRGSHVVMDICRAVKRDGSEGDFERIVITQHKNPTLHQQAKRSLWGDLWPLSGEDLDLEELSSLEQGGEDAQPKSQGGEDAQPKSIKPL